MTDEQEQTQFRLEHVLAGRGDESGTGYGCWCLGGRRRHPIAEDAVNAFDRLVALAENQRALILSLSKRLTNLEQYGFPEEGEQ